MSDTPAKFSFASFLVAAGVVWAIVLGVGFYTKLNTYEAITIEEIRSSPELISALGPTIAFQCYGSDESKIDSNLECENLLLLDRDRMLFYMKTMQIYSLYFFTAPLIMWILYMAFPKAFAPIRRRFK